MASERLKNGYQFVATTWMTTSLLFALVIGVCYLGMWFSDRKNEVGHYSAGFHAAALHSLPAEDAHGFFKEFDQLGDDGTFEYQPWVGFSERVFRSNRLNVDAGMPLPHRHTIAPLPTGKDKKVVWMFGGSTLFGWGVPDDQTIPSHVARLLAVRFPDCDIEVVNHGHCFFYSSQELLLFQLMLRAGQHCDVAIFLDGLNEINAEHKEGREQPAFTGRAAKAFRREQEMSQPGGRHLFVSPQFPPFRLGRALGLGKPPAEPEVTEAQMMEVVANVARVYPFNVDLARRTAAMKGVRPLFLWQPTPEEYFDPGRHNPRRADMNRRILATVKGDDFHSLLDLFKDEKFDGVYVDQWHYGDKACQRVAERIVEIVANGDYLASPKGRGSP
ncbi:MAG: hypothetical protein K2R98_22320 [Gemmataceae bacterium]|nr:hypothetical protein [Gemmataceae bacterium]